MIYATILITYYMIQNPRGYVNHRWNAKNWVQLRFSSTGDIIFQQVMYPRQYRRNITYAYLCSTLRIRWSGYSGDIIHTVLLNSLQKNSYEHWLDIAVDPLNQQMQILYISVLALYLIGIQTLFYEVLL
jgi:hypothetical protein